MLKIDPKDRERLIDPLFKTKPLYWIVIVILLAIIAWGGYMYIRQVILGLGETGMQRPAYWGVYMVNFIFLIGVSMAGTLISASLELIDASWRHPITRIAETITVFGLMIAGMQVIIDMGRPERLLYVFSFGRLQSPLLWDMASLTTYIMASMFALLLPLIPDMAIMRDNYPETGPKWRRKLYTMLSFGWRGNKTQWLRLKKTMHVVAILIIPIGVSLHTITSWIFATTVQPGWHSTIFGPYFVVGAIFSGLGLLFIVMAALRRLLHLDDYITPKQFSSLSGLFIVMSAVWFYFTYTENLTLAAGQQTAEFPVLSSKLWGQFAPSFWAMVFLMVIAFWILVVPRLIPNRKKLAFVFAPKFGFASGAAAVVLLMLMTIPAFQPIQTALSSSTSLQSIVWVVAIVLMVLAGLGIANWLKSRLITALVLSSIAVVVGMWLERWNIIIPTVTHPRLIGFWFYHPTITEIAISSASAAMFGLLLMIFFKIVPSVSLWEIAEGRVVEDAESKIEIPLPEATAISPKVAHEGFTK